METTTKNCKTEKLKVKADMLEVTVKVWEIMQSVLKKEKERLQWKGFAEKGFKSGMEERVGDEK